QVLGVQHADEAGVVGVVAPDEAAELLERPRRIVGVELHRALGVAQRRVGTFEDGAEQPVLAAEVVVDHALTGAGALRDPVAARACETVLRELDCRGLQDPAAGGFGVAPALRGSLAGRRRGARSARPGRLRHVRRAHATIAGTSTAGGVLRLRWQRTMPSIITMPTPGMSPSRTL